MGRFDDVTIAEDKTAFVARNSEWRVLFRYNRWTTEFAVYRSHRMTETEKELIMLQMERIFRGKVPDLDGRKAHVMRFLNYETKEDTYCS